MMSGSNTVENYEAASLPERIGIVHNTFHGNNHGITGGDSTVVVDNIFCHTTNLALKNLDAGSIASHNLFFANGTDQSQSNVDAGTTVLGDPKLQPDASLGTGSPAIDAGTASFLWNGMLRWQEPAGSWNGSAPDLGAKETGSVSVREDDVPGVRLLAPAPNPGRGPIALRVELAVAGRVRLDIVDLLGRRVRSLVDQAVTSGRHAYAWDGRTDRGALARAGVYVVRLVTADGVASRSFTRLE
jgi:hypothetical protein